MNGTLSMSSPGQKTIMESVSLKNGEFLHRKVSVADKRDVQEVFEMLDTVDGQKDNKIETKKLIQIILNIENKDSLTNTCIHFGPQKNSGHQVIGEEELRSLMLIVDTNKDGYITENEFRDFWCSTIIQNQPEITASEEDILREYFTVVSRAKIIRKCPPPLFIIIVCFIQLLFFIIYKGTDTSLDSLIFYSGKRQEVWRYFTYSLIHKDYEHIFMNIALQLLVGLPLEVEHKAPRTASIYILGVLSGSLGSYRFDPHHSLLGASGGVYSLIAANLSTLILNWDEDAAIIWPRFRTEMVAHARDGKLLRFLKLAAVILFCLFDIGYTLYRRYSQSVMDHGVSYTAHITGAFTGILVGFCVLKDRHEHYWERVLKFISLTIYIFCLLHGVIYNVTVTVSNL